MDTLPLPIKELRLKCSAFEASELTKYFQAKPFREILCNALDDKHKKLFYAAKSFDFDSEVVHFDSGATFCKARVHAALCFKEDYFSVTIRGESKGGGRKNPLARFRSPITLDSPLPTEDLDKSPYCRIVDREIPKKLDPGQEAGLLLVSGATGSGKTTFLNGIFTLQAQRLLAVESVRRPHFVVIGDPVETPCYRNVNQPGKYRNAGHYQEEEDKAPEPFLPFDFTSRTLGLDVNSVDDGLRDALRETPKAVIVSELRNDEDFRAALRFAATGHLIFATSHNTSLVDTFSRLMDVSGADTPSKRAALVQRLLAVIHLRQVDGERIPALWRSTPMAIASFVAEGLSSIIAGGKVPLEVPQANSISGNLRRAVLGRHWMIEAWSPYLERQQWEKIRKEAMQLDLSGI
jgi:hypothetical protein